MTPSPPGASATQGTAVGFTLDSWGDLALLLVPALLLVAVPLLLLPLSRRHGSSLADQLRIRLAVLRYDAWLDLRGAGRRRRRELRRELHANLVDSTARVGGREAVRRLGPLRRLAAESVDAAPPGAGPRWARGGGIAVCAIAAVLLLELLAAMWWAGGAHDSGVPTVRGSLLLFPGSVVELSRAGGGTSLELRPGWLVPAAAAVTFVAVSRPWLLLTKHGKASRPRATAP